MDTSKSYTPHQVISNTGATGFHLSENVISVLEEYNSVNTI